MYVYLVWIAVSVVTTQGSGTTIVFNDQMASALSLIGGLVSALVIAELAITKPGEMPLQRAYTDTDKVSKKAFIRIVTIGYVIVWIITGLTAFIVSLRKPDILQPLTDLGQTWLGLAVAAGYAYFGITPK
jgi:hypothetical protein